MQPSIMEMLECPLCHHSFDWEIAHLKGIIR